MKEIFFLKDYNSRFESKHDDVPYRSGLIKDKLASYLKDYGFNTTFLSFADIDFRKNELVGKPVFYTSQEDIDYYYKSYIEDIVYGLELAGVNVIPTYKFLRANNNKILMEILRDQLKTSGLHNIKSYYFGSLEESLKIIEQLKFPVVVKGAGGAMSKNVALAKNKDDYIRVVKKISNTKNTRYDLKERVREYKHKGYLKQSSYRKKFIVQTFIPELSNDWKIYVFGEQYFIFYRPIFKHMGFRASGGGYDNYFYGLNAKIPDGIFDFAKSIYDELNCPYISIDIAQDSKGNFYLLEFQLVYFGTAGILKKYSKKFFQLENGKWIPQENHGDIEYAYAQAIATYLEKS